MVSHEYPPIGGGGANACMHLAKEYVGVGHDVTIVTAWYVGLQEHESYDNIEIYRVRSKRKHAEHCGFVEMLDYLIKAIPLADRLERKKRFDVCQVFFGIPSGPIGYMLKLKYKLPYVIRFGGGDIPGFQDRFAFVYKAVAPAIKLVWNEAAALVANSEGLKKLAEGFYDKKDIRIIPNGADLRAFSQGANVHERRRDGAIRLLFVSRLIERKGLQDILPQMSDVVKECSVKGISVGLDIVGDGPYRGELETIVEEGKLANIVQFHGQKVKEELPAFYSDADIFLFPSRKEGMPNVVLEAMSYGLPILMTPCQGSDELIDGNGYVLNAEDFGKRIVELCFDESTRKRMGARSGELVEKRFSWKNTAKAYMEIFGKAII